MLVEHLRRAGDQVEVYSLPWRNYLRHLGDNLSSALFQRLHRAELDVLLQDEFNHPSLAWLNRRLRRYTSYPIFAIVHHLPSSEVHSSGLRRFYRWVERRYLASVDGFIFNTQTTRDVVENLIGKGRPSVVAKPPADPLPLVSGRRGEHRRRRLVHSLLVTPSRPRRDGHPGAVSRRAAQRRVVRAHGGEPPHGGPFKLRRLRDCLLGRDGFWPAGDRHDRRRSARDRPPWRERLSDRSWRQPGLGLSLKQAGFRSRAAPEAEPRRARDIRAKPDVGECSPTYPGIPDGEPAGVGPS